METSDSWKDYVSFINAPGTQDFLDNTIHNTKPMSKEEYKKWFLKLDPQYIIFDCIDKEEWCCNDGTSRILPYGCTEIFTSKEWYQLYEDYRNTNEWYKLKYGNYE